MKKRLIYKFSGVFFIVELVILFFASSCCNTVPRVTTGQATEIERTNAKCGGVVNDDGGGNCDCSERGVCWSTNPSPTISDSRTSDGVGIGSYTSNLDQLSSNETYFVRAYATNAQGTAYGNEISFTTKDITTATVTTSPISSVTPTSAVSGGTITDDGGSPVTAKGVCWAKTENPDINSENKTTNGTGSETFTSNITGLQSGAAYYVRAYATNIKGTSYGQNLPLTTVCPAPSATTNLPTGVTSNSATLNGTVKTNGNNCPTEVVFEYGTTTSYGSIIAATPGTVTGTNNTPVSAALTGLTPGQIYHYRVKAISSGGTTNGSDQIVNPSCPAPSATTNPADPVGTTTATLKGTVNANNCSTTITFEYGETTSYGSTAAASPGTVTGSTNTSVSANISGLTPCKLYHYRVKAVNSGGTTYGSDRSFTTGGTAPTATTNPADLVGTTTATLKGTVNANNSSTTVTFEYGTTTSYGSVITATPSPVTGSSNTNVSASISGLTPGQTYHYRVKAVNCGGTTYGSDLTLIRDCTKPSATTIPASPVGTTTATLKGTVNADNCPTTVTFEYGETTSYDKTVIATPSTVTGNSITAVSANISGLTPCKLYHFRVKAVNSGGTTYGSDQQFTTGGTRPTVTTSPATPVGTTTATLRGIVNANNTSTKVTFDYGKTTSYGSTITATPGTVTGTSNTSVGANISGLTSNSTYYYRVKAVNCGYTIYGSMVSFKTEAACKDIEFVPPSILRLCPKHIGGDREFGGNGPKVTASANLRIVNKKEIWVDLYLHEKETVSDWTECLGSPASTNWTWKIYTVPSGWTINSILTSQSSSISYTDTDHALDSFILTGLVSKFEIMGDTDGNDVGNCTADDAYMSVYFNKVRIQICEAK